jgi:hypothetical protein
MLFRVKTRVEHTVWVDVEDAPNAEVAEVIAKARVKAVLEDAFGGACEVTGEAITETPLGVSW